MGAAFCFMASSMFGNPIIAGYAASLGANGTLMGVVAALLSIVALFCRPVAGNLADKSHKRRLVLIGAVLFVAANLIYAWAPNIGVLMLGRVINGIGFACVSVCLAAWLSMLLPISRMGAGMGLYGMVNALAQAVGPALGIQCAQSIGYRTAFVIAAILAACMVIMVMLIKDAGKPVRKKSTAGGFNNLFEVKVIPIAFIFMLFAIPYFANQSFLVDYASQRHLAVTVSLFFPVYAVAILILRLLMRNWFDTKSFPFFLIIGTIGTVVMISCLTFMRNDWIMFLGAIATAFGYGMMSSVTQSQAVLVAGKSRAGMANTTYYAGIDLGMSIGPLLGGFLFGAIPLQYFYAVMLLVLPVIWLIFVIFRRTIDVKKH